MEKKWFVIERFGENVGFDGLVFLMVNMSSPMPWLVVGVLVLSVYGLGRFMGWAQAPRHHPF